MQLVSFLTRRILSVLVLLTLGLGAIGCETTEGAGRDIENAGDAIEDTAKDVKD